MKDCSKGYEKKLASLSLLRDPPREMRVKASGNAQLTQLRFPDKSTVSIPYIHHFGLDPEYKPRICLIRFGLLVAQVTLQFRPWSKTEPVVVQEVVIISIKCTKDAGDDDVSR